MELQSVKVTAERFHISERRVQKLCEAGRIEGAQMISNVWVIPSTAKKPIDERMITSADGLVSLADLCNDLSISIATGRNWVKLGKLIPTTEIKRTPYFEIDYAEKIKEEIISGKNSALKSRRNKKYITGNKIYNSYVSEKSTIIPVIQSLIDIIESEKIKITNDILLAILADCAVQLILAKTDNLTNQIGIAGYLKNIYKQNKFMFLVDDLLCQTPNIANTINSYPNLFDIHYKYEEGEDILGLLYISLKNIGSRKASGAYYTPTRIVKKLCNKLFSMNCFLDKTIFDPCCGTGNFILQLPNTIDYNYIYGNDIDSISVKIARINYALKFMVYDKEILYNHITVQDYLTFSFDIKYDYIIGNPPWGYEFSKTDKDNLRNKYSSAVGANIESYDVFVEQALNNLNDNGVLSFVLPEAFLNVKTHRSIRSLLLNSYSLQYLEFLGNAFDKVHCPCIIIQTIHNNKPFSTAGLTVNDGVREFMIHTNRVMSANCFSLDITDEEYSILNKIDHINNKVILGGNSIFALGIVTGNNKKYISTQKSNENEMVLKGSDLCKFRFKDTNHYIIFKPESFQQIAPTEYYRANEKLLYRFICNQLVFAYDNKQTLSLNSCNILIPKIEGLGIKYIMAILNSRPAQFYFKKQFNSIKVLRSHIEQIPIPYINKQAQDKITALVDSILIAPNNDAVTKLYESLDDEISNLYGLSDNETQLIKKSIEGENMFLF